MLDDAFAHLEGQVEPGEIQIPLLELLDDPQGMEIVVESSAVRAQQLIELVLARMAERRMADVVNQRQGLGQIGVQRERARDGARDLRDFQRMRQAIAEVVGESCGEDLGLGFQAPERARVDDAVAVARVVVTVGMRRFRKAAAARAARVHRIGCQGHCRALLNYCMATEGPPVRRRC